MATAAPSEALPGDENLSAFQLRERKERTVFVGNLPLTTTRHEIEKLFRKYGPIEKVWFRSLALDHMSKLPQKAKIIKGEFGEQKDNKNAYVLFKAKEEAGKAAEGMN